MKVLLDECLPRKLKRDLSSHEIATVPEMGWAGIKNGPLLRLAEANFDVFVTVDQNLEHQQNLRTSKLAIIVLTAPDNQLETLRPLVPQVLKALRAIKAGDFVEVSALR